MEKFKKYGIYSLQKQQHSYYIILKSYQLNTHLIYLLTHVSVINNRKIQEILDIRLLNDTLKIPMFMEIHDRDIQTMIDGYLGVISDRIGDELLNFYEMKVKNNSKIKMSHL